MRRLSSRGAKWFTQLINATTSLSRASVFMMAHSLTGRLGFYGSQQSECYSFRCIGAAFNPKSSFRLLLELISFLTVAREFGGKGPSQQDSMLSVREPPLPTLPPSRSSFPAAYVLGKWASGYWQQRRWRPPDKTKKRPSHGANTFCQRKEKWKYSWIWNVIHQGMSVWF